MQLNKLYKHVQASVMKRQISSLKDKAKIVFTMSVHNTKGHIYKVTNVTFTGHSLVVNQSLSFKLMEQEESPAVNFRSAAF